MLERALPELKSDWRSFWRVIELAYEKTIRRGMIFNFATVWDMSEGLISDVKDRLSKRIDAQATERLSLSFDTLKDIVVTLETDEEYPDQEDPLFFKELIEKMEDVFKYVFEAYMIEQSKPIGGNDSIDYLNKRFYEDIAARRKIMPPKYVPQAYPPITLLIRLLRNCQKHETKWPVDHMTGEKSFGNVYTLCSALILAVYAYKEILERWLETDASGC